MTTIWLLAAVLGALALLAAAGYVLAVTGALTLDTGLGRRVRPLGPLTVSIAAPRQLVFEQIAVPYLSPQPPRALREKVSVLERGGGMVLAAHRTRVGLLTAVTVETVLLEPPSAVSFRLLRGPVPHVVERFDLAEREGHTELRYTGELGTDFWVLGRIWGNAVARTWSRAVAASLEGVRDSAERLASQRRER
jgi:hypothetical protein